MSSQDTVIKAALGAMFLVAGYSIVSSFGKEDSLDHKKPQYDVNVQQYSGNDQLDLKAVGSLLAKAKDTEDFEKQLNSKETGINNLDLNGDGKVDYIKVEEFHEGDIRGLNLTSEPKPGVVKEIATIKIEKKENSPEKAVVETRGNPELYGQGAYYHSPWSGIGTGLMLGYLFSGGHRPWSSPYSYGHYPSHYQSYNSIPQHQYRSYSSSRFGNSSFQKSSTGRYNHVKSPFEKKFGNKTASSFSKKSSSRTIQKGGFGKKTISPKPRSRTRSFRPRSGRRGGFGRRR